MFIIAIVALCLSLCGRLVLTKVLANKLGEQREGRAAWRTSRCTKNSVTRMIAVVGGKDQTSFPAGIPARKEKSAVTDEWGRQVTKILYAGRIASASDRKESLFSEGGGRFTVKETQSFEKPNLNTRIEWENFARFLLRWV